MLEPAYIQPTVFVENKTMMKNMNNIKYEIFEQIKNTYQITNPELRELLTLDNVTGKEVDALVIQLKKVKKQYLVGKILTGIGVVMLTLFTVIGLLKSNQVSASLGLLAITALTLLVLTNKSKMFIKAIENQIFLYRLLDKIDNEFAASEK